MKGGNQNYKELITSIVKKHFGLYPKNIKRMSMGTCNEVYSVDIENREIIMRLSLYEDFLKGSQKHIPILSNLAISVPNIILEDYSKKEFPYMFHILNKMEGKDIDYVISNLSDLEIEAISIKISSIFDKVKTIKTNNKFGLIYGGVNKLSKTWTEWIEIWIKDIIERGTKTGLLDNRIKLILMELFFVNKNYFEQVVSITYLGDINAKNVLINNGKFVGIIDLDCLMQGDILEGIGRIKASWPGTVYGEKYVTAIMNKQGLDKRKRKIVTLYALFNRISRAFENGIQYNQNTTSVIDYGRYKNDLKIIDLLLEEYRN